MFQTLHFRLISRFNFHKPSPLFFIMKLSKKALMLVGLLSFVLPITIGSGQALAYETLQVNGGMALNTNNNLRKVDGSPVMTIYRHNVNDIDQHLTRVRHSDGSFSLQQRSTGKCVNAHYLWDGAEINTWNCDPNDADQKFDVINLGNNVEQFRRRGTNLCIDTPFRYDLGRVQLGTCNSSNPNQRWTSTIVSNPTPPFSLPGEMPFSFFRDNWRTWAEYTVRNPFPNKGQNCTWYAHGRMMQLGFSEYTLDSMLGNAGMWDDTAGRGAYVIPNAQAGTIAVWEAGVNGAGSVGHVAVVERVNSNGTIVISESNWPTGSLYGVRTIPANSPSKFIVVPRT
jgi:hypothetical protein